MAINPGSNRKSETDLRTVESLRRGRTVEGSATHELHTNREQRHPLFGRGEQDDQLDSHDVNGILYALVASRAP